jgi:CRISPR-associated endonuclease Csn1
MSKVKIRRFLAQSMPNDFATRQLNDTGYAARQAVTFLKRLWPDVGPEGKVNVQPVKGKVTAHLRRLWGLNNILSDDGEKTRADHRHHAIDALVVACADPSVSHRLSRYWKLRDTSSTASQKPQLDPPWSTIRQEADRAVQEIVVSHRVRKKVSGPLHSGSIYGDTKREITVGNVDYRVVVERVPVRSLSLRDLLSDNLEQNRYQIADDGVRIAIEKYLEQNGIDVANYKRQPKIKPSKDDLKILEQILVNPIPFGDTGTVIRKVRVLTRKQLHLMMHVHNGLSPEDSNHHFALYRGMNGKLTELPVSLNTALVRNKRGEPIIRKELDDGSRLLFSISKGDIIEFDDERARYWVVRMLASNGQICIVPHNEARPDKAAIKYLPFLKGLVEKNVKKISVDPIGRIRPAHD